MESELLSAIYRMALYQTLSEQTVLYG